PLRQQYSILVTVKRRRPGRCAQIAITLPLGGSEQRAERARRLSLLDLPEEPIFLAGAAPEFLRVLSDIVSVAIQGGVLALRVDDGSKRVDRGELVVANAAVQQLLLPELRIERPARVDLHQRKRERNVVAADEQDRLHGVFIADGMSLVEGSNEPLFCQSV